MKQCAFCGSHDHEGKDCPWPKDSEGDPPPPAPPDPPDPYDGFLMGCL